jgi:hypothetical protein
MTNQPQEQPQPPPAPRHHPRRSRSAARRAWTVPGTLLPALAAALALAVTSGTALTASATGQPTGNGGWSPTDSTGQHAKFVDTHGLVLTIPQLYLIYWGAVWQVAPTPTAAQVTGAVRTLLGSAYLTGLTQYRGSGRGILRGSAVINSSDPPDGFTDEQVTAFVDAQIAAGAVPSPDPDNQTVYGVVMPTGITADVGRRAEHNSYTRSGRRIHYAWFTNVGDLDSITALISHELVEAATDPDGGGFLGVNGTCNEPGWCEIADVCESRWSKVDGVAVLAYWSNRDHDCIAPGSAAPKHPSKPSEAPGDPPTSTRPTRVGTGHPRRPGRPGRHHTPCADWPGGISRRVRGGRHAERQ